MLSGQSNIILLSAIKTKGIIIITIIIIAIIITIIVIMVMIIVALLGYTLSDEHSQLIDLYHYNNNNNNSNNITSDNDDRDVDNCGTVEVYSI